MSMMRMVKRFKITTRSNKNAKSISSISSHSRFNEYYRNLLQQFGNHCRTSNRDVTDPDWLVYRHNDQNRELPSGNEEKPKNSQIIIPGIPHVQFNEILEIGSVAGTENRYLELISAEWRNTKVSLKRHTFKECEAAIRADIEILSEIRHPNILLLMATTHTDKHGLVSVFEPVDCTLYNYIHVQGERMNLQGIMQIGIRLADALKYCHMRGYIHGAISSHCTYFASNSIKLGGWELARKMETIYLKRNYEKYLRVEIDKWQAPETSCKLYFTKKSDVYCLMLLLWEMCTGRVPCDGNDWSDIESEYVTRNPSLSLRNIPSLLRNLLETGLQYDEANRTLDMDKVGRELHRLLVIHEYEKSDANECETNSNDSLCDISNIMTSSPSRTVECTKSSAKQLYSSTIKSKEPIYECLTSDKQERDEDLRRILRDKIEEADTSAISNAIAIPATEASVTGCTSCADILNVVQDIDEENNVRADIKRLKQLIASQRRHFFLESNSISCPKTNSEISNAPSLKKSNSFDYITCKPASHTTAMEPRFNKSLNEFDVKTVKSSYTLQRKPPYMSMPTGIKNAIIQRQVLHPDTKSFYESTLWRKEKEICLSRMGRDSKERDKISSLQFINDGLSTIGEDKAQYLDATNINGSCIEAEDNKENTDESLSRNVKSMSTRLPSSANKSIQDLKNALERATDIIYSIKPTKLNNIDFNKGQECESAFEGFVTRSRDSQEISVIDEKSTSDNKFSYKHISTENIEAMGHRRNFNQTSVNDEKLDSLAIMFTRIKRFEKLTQNDAINEQSTNSQEGSRNKTVFANSTMPPFQRQTEIDFQLKKREEKKEEEEERYVNIPISSPNMSINSQRSVSLPTRLNPIKMDCLKPTNKSIPTSTRCMTEDLYIDDELEGSNLNYNLVLLGDDYEYLLDTSSDDQRLPQTTEL